jgi:hypothetical protein
MQRGLKRWIALVGSVGLVVQLVAYLFAEGRRPASPTMLEARGHEVGG